MISPSRKFLSIKTSETIRISEKANSLIRQGVEVVNLAASEPVCPTPDFINNAAIDAIHAGMTKYTDVNGTLELRQEVCNYFRKYNGIEYNSRNVIVGTGASQVIYNALSVTLEEGDEVVIPKPYWVSYPEFVKICGGIPIYLECSDDEAFSFNIEGLKAAISPKTKWIILNSPNNPTGKILSKDELSAIGIIAAANPHVSVLCDNIYENVRQTSMHFPNIVETFPNLKERTFMVSGVSKAYNMTGWRIGFGAGPDQLISAMSALQSQSTTNPCSISQAAALHALRDGDDFIQGNRHRYDRIYDILTRGMNAIPGLKCRAPDGGIAVFVNCRALLEMFKRQSIPLKTDVDLSLFLVDKARVAVVPGTAFGMPGFVRVSCGEREEKIKAACEQIRSAIGAVLPDGTRP